MILLYSFLLLLLGVTCFLLRRRAGALERAYARAAVAADQMLHEVAFKGGTNKQDQYQIAKRQYLLGRLVQRRDRLEVTHDLWQHRAERCGRTLAALRRWKGRTLPYTFGALDVWYALQLVDYFGVGDYVSARTLYRYVATLIGLA
jgi:hypothetical protein